MKLVINAPDDKHVNEGKRSFEATMSSGVGDGYAISMEQFAQLSPGRDKVVLLDKYRGRRAEGKLVALVPNGFTETGMQRYDVVIGELHEVAYLPEYLLRTGVAVEP